MSDIREDISVKRDILFSSFEKHNFIMPKIYKQFDTDINLLNTIIEAMQEYADKVAKERVIEFGLWIKTIDSHTVNRHSSTQLYYKFIKETNTI